MVKITTLVQLYAVNGKGVRYGIWSLCIYHFSTVVDFSSEKFLRVGLLDTGTPSINREIYSENADDGTRTRNPSIINRVL